MREVATYAAMKSGLKVFLRCVSCSFWDVATYAAMKSGLKDYESLCVLFGYSETTKAFASFSAIVSSNLCRDEKRTESFLPVDITISQSVATYAAMKSGLKV